MSYVRESFTVQDGPKTLSGLLDTIGAICSEAPTLVIIDEYPYMSKSLKHADSMLQGFIDGPLAETGSKIILCGSQMSSMLDIVKDDANPLYNRLRWSMEVREMSFLDTCLFHPEMDDLDQMRMYMVFGGCPSTTSISPVRPSGRSYRGGSSRQVCL